MLQALLVNWHFSARIGGRVCWYVKARAVSRGPVIGVRRDVSAAPAIEGWISGGMAQASDSGKSDP
ncbi:MAG TPA: hypothetical protein VFC78_17265 [Tepidisphaeraceae bacterium]|nr:hypothetical protein [Tepidisphaeraceae bacterium]